MDKDKYVVSACLAGHHCRFDGEAKLTSKIKELVDQGKAVLVCPEVDGGLSTPRPASEITTKDGERRVINNQGEDVTEEFVKGAEVCLQKAQEFGAGTAILKAKSPSCGYGKIYDGTFSGKLTDGDGLAAELLAKAGLRMLSETDFKD